MAKLSSQHYRKLRKLFERKGFYFKRQASSHIVLDGKDLKRPLIIPAYQDVPVRIIQGLLRVLKTVLESIIIR